MDLVMCGARPWCFAFTHSRAHAHTHARACDLWVPRCISRFTRTVPQHSPDRPSSCAEAMPLCSFPHCFGCSEGVRWCPRCSASFAVCAMHRRHALSCPWPAKFMIPCSTQVPAPSDDHLLGGPRPCEPMYLWPQDFVLAWCPDNKPARQIVECVGSSEEEMRLIDSPPSTKRPERSVVAQRLDIQ